MGNTALRRVNFADVQTAQDGAALIISVLHENDQSVLIYGTVSCREEIEAVEAAIKKKTPILIYGRHANDEAIYKKYHHIASLGGYPLIYTGGLFEWLLLQEIHDTQQFRTHGYTLDFLKYSPPATINARLLTY